MNKKRVTLLCSSFPPETGAAPSRMYHLGTMLHQRGYAVTVICAMPNYPTGKIFGNYKGKIFSKENVNGMLIKRIWLIPTNSSSKTKRSISLLSYSFSLFTLGFAALLKSRPDFILISSPPFVNGYIGVLLARFTKAKVILNISDLWPKTAFDLGFLRKGWLYNFLLHCEKKMYRSPDAISAQSDEIKKYILDIEPSKALFVYRNLQPLIPQADVKRPEGKRKIVYAGLLGIAQGVFAIIKAINFAGLNTELHIYGQGKELEEIKEWTTSHPENGVFYHGSVPANQLPDLLVQYHAMLIPLTTTIDGAVPSKIFNAMANGLPIFFSGNGEAADIVLETQTGLASPAGDYDALSRNIRSFLETDNEKYEQIRQNCLLSIKHKYNKEMQDDSFCEFIENI